jgi:hypothetical protein
MLTNSKGAGASLRVGFRVGAELVPDFSITTSIKNLITQIPFSLFQYFLLLLSAQAQLSLK